MQLIDRLVRGRHQCACRDRTRMCGKLAIRPARRRCVAADGVCKGGCRRFHTSGRVFAPPQRSSPTRIAQPVADKPRYLRRQRVFPYSTFDCAIHSGYYCRLLWSRLAWAARSLAADFTCFPFRHARGACKQAGYPAFQEPRRGAPSPVVDFLICRTIVAASRMSPLPVSVVVPAWSHFGTRPIAYKP
jgi:hypothetical protein